MWEQLSQIVKAAFTCSHARCNVVEGKTFCPDCGHGVVFRWKVLKCVQCKQRRACGYRFRQVVPLETCCTYCGEHAVTSHFLAEPEYYQLRQALLSFEVEPEELVWVSQITAVIQSCLDVCGFSTPGTSPSLPVRLLT